MEKLFSSVKKLIFSATAKDTYVLFTGNVGSAFLGFLFTLLVARALSIEEFGVFSAATNLIVIIASLTDLGISSAIINFVSLNIARGRQQKANEFLKAALIIRFLSVLVVSFLIALFAKEVAVRFLATNEISVSYFVAIIPLTLVFWFILPYALQGYRRFLDSVWVDLSLGIPRVIIGYLIFLFLGLTIVRSLWVYALAAFFPLVLGLALLGTSFLKTNPRRDIYEKLLKFSGWLGVNRIISSISGRLDIQMLAALAGASVTGIYSIPAKLAAFIVVLSSSFSAVLAPRLAAFENREKEKRYILKATLAMVPITLMVLLWILIARPFITLLFGEKYLDSVVVFRALAASMIPFLLTAPSVTAIVYALKKPVFIGAFSFFQLVAIFLLNFMFIPKYGALGPTLTFGIVNTILAIYSWIIVIKYYFLK